MIAIDSGFQYCIFELKNYVCWCVQRCEKALCPDWEPKLNEWELRRGRSCQMWGEGRPVYMCSIMQSRKAELRNFR